jgi:hypothetical protein
LWYDNLSALFSALFADRQAQPVDVPVHVYYFRSIEVVPLAELHIVQHDKSSAPVPVC